MENECCKGDIGHHTSKRERMDTKTETEKKEHPTYKTEGGFLKSFRRLENAQRWWNELPDEDKQEIKGIPNFDADIFFQCTGIRVD